MKPSFNPVICCMLTFSYKILIFLLAVTIGLSSVALRVTDSPTSEFEFSHAISEVEPVLETKRAETDSDMEKFFGTPLVWEFLLNDDQYGRLAVVRSEAEAHQALVPAKLRLECPSTKGSVQILVGDMEKTGFDLSSYPVSGAPLESKNVIEVRTVSPSGIRMFKTLAEGNNGYENLTPTIVYFTLLGKNRLERLIAKGSTEVTFTIHDVKDYRKTISVTFPALDLSSQMVKDLNGCRQNA